MTAPHELTAVEQCAALAGRTISAVELTAHYLERIDRLGGPLGAFVVTSPELALKEAAAADRLLAEGPQPDRPLLGLPIAFKDLQPIAGVPVTNGSTAIPAYTAEVDAAAVGSIRAAGTVTLGTTHAPEFGIPCYTASAVVGRAAVTPYAPGRSASGSSGGAASAVAAGLVPVGHGSDGAGSVRTPAAVCGLVGIKPSRGVVSSAPNPSFFAFTTDGPLARTVADAALLLDAMTVRRPAGLYEVRTGQSLLAATGRPPRGPLRIAVWTDSGLDEPHPETVRAVARVAALLEELGHEIVELTNPAPWDAAGADSLFDYIAGVVSSMLAGMPSSAAAALQADTRWMRERGDRLTAAGFVRSTATLASLSTRLIAGLTPYDLALTPVSSGPAVPLGHFHAGGSEAPAMRMLRWSAYTPLQNTSGLPAVSLPSHLTPDGLPIGVQLTGADHGSDQLLLSVAAQLEDTIGWQTRHPPQWWD
ncbi:amidase [Kribbella solani]|uniref:Amidase n=1 Tax=Kribbella solani TaxID=236067 RepID=A0A841DHG3_9ACTN|nr:amidase [Kribbella solani]MBB5977341.1 amidase [Kribbella solani]